MGYLSSNASYCRILNIATNIENAIVEDNKVKNGRLLLKAEDRFFEILEEKVPGRIRVPQADIVFYASVRADAVKHGEDVQEYYKKLTTPETDGPDILV